jgi:hypothetical protein
VRLVKKYLGPLARRVNFLNADSAALAKRLWWIPRLVTGTDPRPMVNVFYEGKQVREYDTQLAWNQISWRKKSSSRDEHDLDGSCGIYWFFPMIPWQGHRIREALEACSEIMLTAGFEPNLGIRFPTDRTVLLACYIGFDREIDGEDERSFACYKQMTTRMASDGYYPYRPGIQGMDLLPPSKDDATTVLQRIKHALDPSDILAHPE